MPPPTDQHTNQTAGASPQLQGSSSDLSALCPLSQLRSVSTALEVVEALGTGPGSQSLSQWQLPDEGFGSDTVLLEVSRACRASLPFPWKQLFWRALWESYLHPSLGHALSNDCISTQFSAPKLISP